MPDLREAIQGGEAANAGTKVADLARYLAVDPTAKNATPIMWRPAGLTARCLRNVRRPMVVSYRVLWRW